MAHHWGVREIVGALLLPAEESKQILNCFGTVINKDTLCMAEHKYNLRMKLRILPCILPCEIELGMVEIVKLLCCQSPPLLSSCCAAIALLSLSSSKTSLPACRAF